jgi:hypothetical protein
MDYLNKVCKIGQGSQCCRYIVAGPEGITCAKKTPFKAQIDMRVARGMFAAKADNCDGLPPDKLLNELKTPE